MNTRVWANKISKQQQKNGTEKNSICEALKFYERATIVIITSISIVVVVTATVCAQIRIIEHEQCDTTMSVLLPKPIIKQIWLPTLVSALGARCLVLMSLFVYCQ